MQKLPLPYNLEAEQGIIACLMLDDDNSVAFECDNLGLTTDSFFHPAHQVMYGVIMSLFKEGKKADLVSIAEKLKSNGTLDAIGGISAIADYAKLIETTSHFRVWSQVVWEAWQKRNMMKLCATAYEVAANGGELDKLISDFQDKAMSFGLKSKSTGLLSAQEAIQNDDNRLESWISGSRDARGLSTGFPTLDNTINGLEKSCQIVIAASTSIGKTSFAVSIVENILNRTNPPNMAFFSVEMPLIQVIQRMLAGMTGISAGHIRDGMTSSDQKNTLRIQKELFKKFPIWLGDKVTGIAELRESARRLNRQHPLGLIVVDYLQLLESKGTQREQKIGDISTQLKLMAKELECPVLVLSQLNRERDKDNRKPKLSDLRDSGRIELDADVILFLHREGEEENCKRELIVAKNRQGSKTSILLHFNPSLTKFTEMVER